MPFCFKFCCVDTVVSLFFGMLMFARLLCHLSSCLAVVLVCVTSVVLALKTAVLLALATAAVLDFVTAVVLAADSSNPAREYRSSSGRLPGIFRGLPVKQ